MKLITTQKPKVWQDQYVTKGEGGRRRGRGARPPNENNPHPTPESEPHPEPPKQQPPPPPLPLGYSVWCESLLRQVLNRHSNEWATFILSG